MVTSRTIASGCGLRIAKTGSRRMIGALDDGRRALIFGAASPSRATPRARARVPTRAEVDLRLADLGDHAGRAHVRNQRHR